MHSLGQRCIPAVACGSPPRLLSLCLLNQRLAASQHTLQRPPGHTHVPFLCMLPKSHWSMTSCMVTGMLWEEAHKIPCSHLALLSKLEKSWPSFSYKNIWNISAEAEQNRNRWPVRILLLFHQESLLPKSVRMIHSRAQVLRPSPGTEVKEAKARLKVNHYKSTTYRLNLPMVKAPQEQWEAQFILQPLHFGLLFKAPSWTLVMK